MTCMHATLIIKVPPHEMMDMRMSVTVTHKVQINVVVVTDIKRGDIECRMMLTDDTRSKVCSSLVQG